ncbi:hypothetical protein QR680_003166 [Steinernema hermaphroditum]|uniref:Neurotransmitter-gated ion-channel ligand-binding domain-containing protein n=1 Tax=Steinernema hermaphroditum TaxID=289476 RepID=A0AA39H5N0_9BILA|nr:hypothetical protein QR680_003166 [Steinernema hermaphroditum]
MRISLIVITLSLLCIIGTVIGNGSTKQILDNIFKSYDKRIRPHSENNTAVIIRMSIVLAILIELRENQQVAAYVISHTQRWNDPHLAWNPVDYNNIREIIVPQSMIWLPKLFVYNSMDTKEMLSDDRYDVRINYNGDVKINMPQFVTCICRLSIEQFPFDTQFCAVALASPLLNTSEMDVVASPPPKDSYFAGNAEWELINVTVRDMRFLEEGEYRAEVHYIFHLQRRPIFYLTVIVAPTFLISALSILGIFSPGANDGPRNEKVSLGLGSLLAMTVLLGIVAGAMPKSNSIPLLGYYILIVILLCAVAVGISMAFLGLSRKFIEKGQMPSHIAYRLMMVQPSALSCRRRIGQGRESKDFYNDHRVKIPDLSLIHEQLMELVETQRMFRRRLEKEQIKHLVEMEWSRIFSRFDYVFLTVFQVLNLIVLMLFLRFAWSPTPAIREHLV